jgi:hypothetical protein
MYVMIITSYVSDGSDYDLNSLEQLLYLHLPFLLLLDEEFYQAASSACPFHMHYRLLVYLQCKVMSHATLETRE